MSFARIADKIEDSDVEVFGGKEKASALLGRLDKSWDDAARTTVGVMLAMSACSPDFDAAQKVLSGMLGVMSRMSDLYCSLMGWQGDPGGSEDIAKMAIEVDGHGVALAGKVGGLGGAVMTCLLQFVPGQWSGHYRLLAETRAGMSRVLVGRSLPYLFSLMAEEQMSRTRQLLAMVDRTVFSPNSKPACRARDWAKAASGVYDACLAGGYRRDAALAEAVRKVGFPKP